MEGMNYLCHFIIHNFVQINGLSQSVQVDLVFPNHQPPSAYTGELFGVEYFFQQSGESFCPTENEVDNLVDEGFDEEEVASEDADCHDDLSATLPVDLESDEVVHIWEHPILQCYGDEYSSRKREVKRAHKRKVRLSNQRFWTVEGSQDGIR